MTVWATFLLLLSTPLARAVHADALPSQIFFFGDSLTDSGNWIRVSNGPVWPEYLCDELGVPEDAWPSEAVLGEGGNNYAFSGGRAIGESGLDLDAQLARYFARHPVADGDALFIVFMGFNDLVPGGDVTEAVAAKLLEVVARLKASGATRVAVVDFWNKGVTPRYLAWEEEGVADDLTSQAFEAGLRVKVQSLFERDGVLLLDAFSLSTKLQYVPGLYGFDYADSGCVSEANCDGYVYGDAIHPTTETHRLIAEEFAAQILPAFFEASSPANDTTSGLDPLDLSGHSTIPDLPDRPDLIGLLNSDGSWQSGGSAGPGSDPLHPAGPRPVP